MEKARENNKTMKVNCIKNTAERCNEKYRLHETKNNRL